MAQRRKFFTVPFKIASNLVCLLFIVVIALGPSRILLIWQYPARWIFVIPPACVVLAVALAVIFSPGLSLWRYLRVRIVRNQPPGRRCDRLPFVGFAYSEFFGQPHLLGDDDVGFVRIGRHAVKLIGETGTRRIPLRTIRNIRRVRSQWYRTLGAERRVAIDYDDRGVFRTVLITPRHGATVFGTNARAAALEAQIREAVQGSRG